MGNAPLQRLPTGDEMRTIAHLQALLDDVRPEDEEIPDGNSAMRTAARCNRAWKRHIDKKRIIPRPLAVYTVFERTLLASLLERTPAFAKRLYSHIPDLDILSAQVGAMICDCLGLKRSQGENCADTKDGRRMSGLKLEKKSYWSVARDIDSVFDLCTFILIIIY